MCHTTVSGIDDDENMDEISSTSLPVNSKKTGKHIEPRKIRKPLMEKKRRARINQSLDELKRIVVDVEKFAGEDLTRVNKLEKADILEMTVKYLKWKSAPAAASSAAVAGPELYTAGYRQCIGQVQELLAKQWTDEWRRTSGRKMVDHLESCAKRLYAAPKRPQSSSSAADDIVSAAGNSNNRNNDSNNTVCSSSSASSSCSFDDDDCSRAPTEDRGTATEFRRDVTAPKSMWRPW